MPNAPLPVQDALVELRAATAADEAAIRGLMRGERVNPFGNDWRNFVVARLAGELVGCAQLRPADSNAVEFGSWVVRLEVRGGGIGSRLVEAALARAAGRRVFLITAAGRGPEFTRWGFRPVPLAAVPWTVGRNWLLGQAGSIVALGHGLRPQRLAILAREPQP